MKITNAAITILVGQDSTTIELRDKDAAVTFCSVTLTPHQLSSALSRLALTPCELTLSGLQKVGKTHESKDFVFEIPDIFQERTKVAIQCCFDALHNQNMSEWIPDEAYNSQGSFFHKGGKAYARTIIRRWVDKPSEELPIL